MVRNLALVLLVSIPPIIMNFDDFMKGGGATLSQGLVSLVFVLLWMFYGVFMGYRKENSFLKFSTLYWGLGYLLCISASVLHLLFLFPVVIIVLGSLFGLKYFYSTPFQIILATIQVVIVWSFSVVGYFIGKALTFYYQVNDKNQHY